jgi:outer membrane murein-binding lipoprotein Lpp
MLKKIFIVTILVFLMTGCVKQAVIDDFSQKVQKAQNKVEVVKQEIKQELEPVKKADSVMPATLDLKAPFVSQAPTGDWSLPYQELCEEAALLSASKYFANEKITEAQMDVELKKVLAWETKNVSIFADINIVESAQIAREYFGLKAEVSTDVTVENIKKQLVAGKLVVVPTAGRLLGSPYYSGLGPISHYLVIRGYDEKNFITNDVGTRTKGDGYKFKQAVIINAIHDLPKKEDGTYWRLYEEDIPDAEKARLIKTGEKRILILSK